MSTKQQTSYLTSAFALSAASVIYVLMIGFINWVKPGLIPFGFWDLWATKGGIGDWLSAGLPFFIWGGGFSFVVLRFTKNKREDNDRAEELLVGDVAKSFAAGLLEEIVYRWLYFYVCFAMVALTNWLILGFAGFGLVQWVHVNGFGPTADWATFGHLSRYVNDPANWLLGAALLASNASFRDGHKYQGLIGLINSWFLGMFFFWLVFTYGLWAAIVVHAVYDVVVFTVLYIDRVLERATR